MFMQFNQFIFTILCPFPQRLYHYRIFILSVF